MSFTVPPSINPMSVSSPPPLLSPQRPTLRSTSAISRDRYSVVAGRAAEEAEKLAQQQAAQLAKQVSLPSRSDRDFDERSEKNDRNDRGSERRTRDTRQPLDDRRNGIPSDLPSDRQQDRSGSMNRQSDRQQDRQHDRQSDRQRLPNSSPTSAGPAPRNDRWGRDDRDRSDRNDRNDRNDRSDRDRNDRNDRDRNDRNDRDRNDRTDRSDRNDRNDRGDRSDRDGRDNRNDRDGRDNRNDRDSRDSRNDRDGRDNRNDSRKPRDDRTAGRNSSYSSTSTGYPTQSSSQSNPASSSSSQTSTVVKSIPVSLGPSPHMLHHKWTLYFDRRAAVKPKGPGSTSFDTTEYESNLIVVGTIVSVESFWQYWRALVPPSQLEANSNYHLFRCNTTDGTPIKPTWEDPANSKGGKWNIKWHARDKDRFDTYALNVCLALIGQQIGAGDSAADQLISGDEINGCVISRRRTGDRLSVWNKSSDEAIVKQIGQSVKQLCVGDSPSQVTLNYDVFEALTH